MPNIQSLPAEMRLDQFLQHLKKTGDFCAGFIPRGVGIDFSQAQVLIERRGDLIFLVTNRGRFLKPGQPQFMTWRGSCNDLVREMQGSRLRFAGSALTLFVSSSPASVEVHLTLEAMEQVHFSAAHLVQGGQPYMVNKVTIPSRFASRQREEKEHPGQPRLF